ncbi:MAG: hypothetical protein AAF483_08250 [Planctomycetota bacterium]
MSRFQLTTIVGVQALAASVHLRGPAAYASLLTDSQDLRAVLSAERKKTIRIVSAKIPDTATDGGLSNVARSRLKKQGGDDFIITAA